MSKKIRDFPKFVASSNGRDFWGWFFIVMGSLSFVGFVYAAVISKLLPPSNNVIIRSIQEDCGGYYQLECSRGQLQKAIIYAVKKEKNTAFYPSYIERCMYGFSWYYCFLVPLTIPILVVSVYFRWLSMKLFKHA